MFNKQELENWINDISRNLNQECSAYLIGGCALCFKGLKPATKDIDMIVSTEKEFYAIDRALQKAGFVAISDLQDEFYITAMAVYEKEQSRIDIFLKEVGKMLALSPSMKKKAALYVKQNNLKVFLMSNEDIFLFKSMTPRAADIDDCDRLMREELNYDVIYDECIEQSSRDKHWYFWLFEKICKLENRNHIISPIKHKLLGIIRKNWKERPSDFMKDVENVEGHIGDLQDNL